jgi:type I restriction enzyme S subunit
MEFEASFIDPLNLPIDWKVLGFPDLVFFQEGPGIRNWQYVERDGVRFVNIRCLEDGRLITSKMSQISKEEAYGKYSHFLLDADDYVVSSSGTLGRVATVQTEDLPCCLNTSVIRMRPANDGLERGYLKYFLFSDYYKSQIFAFANGSAQLNYGPTHLKQMEIIAPPVADQKAIAHILGTLDDKIEQNRKTNETLEAIAKALFKSWFVDFDPVRAKAEGCPTGLPAEISDLFPDSFEDSELGEIPSGWEVKAISNLCRSISSGGTPSRKNSEYWIGGTIGWFKTGELRDSFLLESEERITQAGLNESSCKYFDKGDILFALYGATVGKMGIVTAPSTANQAAACLRPLEEIGTPFLEGMLYATRERLMNIATGAAQQNLYLGVVKEHAVVAPCKPLPKMFSQLVDPINQRRLCCLKESSSLSSFRDALLPKLISGEIRIPDAKKMLEEVGV